MTRNEKVNLIEDACNEENCGSDCKFRDICDRGSAYSDNWLDADLDEAVRRLGIDPETGELLAAIIADLDARPDVVNHPQHYELPNGLECIDAMVATLGKETVMAFCKANAFKYLWRHERKNGAEDVEKARWYLNKWHDLHEASDEAR